MKNYLPKISKSSFLHFVFALLLIAPGTLLAQCPDLGDSPNPPNCANYSEWETYFLNNCQCDGPFAFQDHDPPTLWIPQDQTIEWNGDFSLNYFCDASAYMASGSYNVLCDLPAPEFQVDDCCTDHYNLLENIIIEDCAIQYSGCLFSHVATVTRTFTATDNCGNTSVKTQKFTLVDTTAPSIHENNVYHYLNCDDNVWDVPNPYAEDACDNNVPVVLVNTITHKLDCPYNFDLERIFSATDNCGNTSYYTQWIHFNDYSGPVLSIASNNSFVECDNIPPAPIGVTAFDECSGSAGVTYDEWINEGPCENEYQIVREWSAHDLCWNWTHVTHTINVTDNTPPVLATPWNLYIECDDPIPANTMTATDNCDNDVAIYFDYYYTDNNPCHTVLHREWWAYDNCGNADYEDQYITLVDVTPPVVFADAEIIVPKGGAVPPHGQATVWDNCTDPEDIIVVESDDLIQELNCLQSVITRTFTAIDQCGNTSQFVQLIYFTNDDFVAPTALCQDITITLDTLGYGAVVGALDLDSASYDNCSIANYMGEYNYDCSSVGVNYATLTVIDAAGNTDQCTSMVTVVENRPRVYCNDLTLELENGIAFLDFPDILSYQTDDCGIVKFETTISEYNFTETGTFPVVLTVYDYSGLSNFCIANVTVIDAIIGTPPVCEPEYFNLAPTGCFSNLFDNHVTLNWDTYTNGTACQLMGNKVTEPNDISVIVGNTNDPACPDSKTIQFSNLEPATVYRWKVRCGCQVSPLIVSPFSPYDYFQTPAPNPGINGEGENGIVKVFDSKTAEINIYPNPNQGEFTLSVELANYNVEIFDLTGKLVWGKYKIQESRLSVELSGLNNGLYQVTVFNEQAMLTEKIVIRE